MRERKRHNLFPEETALLLPSIQNAVEHFRKTMKRQQSNLTRLPLLNNGDAYPGGRIKYQHRTTEEAVRNSENWDRLRGLLHDENVTNSIDEVFEANKPTISTADSLNCSPPLVTKDEANDINQFKDQEAKKDKNKDLSVNSSTDETQNENKTREPLEEMDYRLILGEKKTDSGLPKESPRYDKPFWESSRKPISDLDSNRHKHNFDTGKGDIVLQQTKTLFLTVPTEEPQTKKKVRFNLEENSPRNVKTYKPAQQKPKQNAPPKSYRLSNVNETHYTSQRTKTGLAMKQLLKGQRRTQRC